MPTGMLCICIVLALTSTFPSLLVIPAAFTIVDDVSIFFVWLFGGGMLEDAPGQSIHVEQPMSQAGR